MNFYPVILTGGAGSRLWPISREFYPKPLLQVVGEQTLLQDTTSRLDGLVGIHAPLLVCNEEHRFLVAEQVRTLGKETEAIMLEPEGRNTAPALTIAALYLVDKDPQAVIVAMPADHVIPDSTAFMAAVEKAGKLAEAGYLVTFGIVAEKPETDYGYIHRGEEIKNSGGYKVETFVEKPDARTAQAYVDAGDYYWNAGIFVLRADRWLEEIGKHQPEILKACTKAMADSERDSDFVRANKEAFLAGPSDSIDYAVMEKTDKAAVVPMETGWSDVGSWSSIWEVSEQDGQGNVARGDVLTHDTTNSLFLAEDRCVAAVGLDNVVVVETTDAYWSLTKNDVRTLKPLSVS
jgi:mannose-1-phosphate guanylyltransferase/mannose-6-phosphate isomerase